MVNWPDNKYSIQLKYQPCHSYRGGELMNILQNKRTFECPELIEKISSFLHRQEVKISHPCRCAE